MIRMIKLRHFWNHELHEEMICISNCGILLSDANSSTPANKVFLKKVDYNSTCLAKRLYWFIWRIEEPYQIIIVLLFFISRYPPLQLRSSDSGIQSLFWCRNIWTWIWAQKAIRINFGIEQHIIADTSRKNRSYLYDENLGLTLWLTSSSMFSEQKSWELCSI
jgi:hypothetical protein